jgi:hypothetical protein
MDRIEEIMTVIEYSLNTRKKRHIIGGVLMSVSLLFGGLAVTIITIKMEESEDEQ